VIIRDSWGSLVKYLQDNYPDWTYCDFEDHANIQDFPEADCIGVAGLGAHAEEGTDTIIFSIGFSSFSDPNLFRQRKAAAQLFEALRRGGNQIKLYDADTAVEKGALVITEGTILAPLTKSDTRPFQTVTAHAKVVIS
jgi:hypothetical protein